MLVRNEVDGPYSYCAGWVVPAQSSGAEVVHPLQLLRGTPTEESVQTLTVDVVQGVPFLMGSVTTDDGNFPPGVNVTLTDPNGDQVRHSETDDRLVVCVNNDPTMVQSCMIQDPMVGTWTITVTNADSSSYVFFSTMPTEAQYTTIIDTLTPYIDAPEAPGAGPEGAAACWTCRVALWTLGIALTMLLVVGAGLLTATAAPVTGLIAILASIGITLAPAGAILVLQALLAGVGATALIVVNNLCSWVNACSTDVRAKITSPTSGTVSGTTPVTASATNAVSVSYYVDGNTPIGTSETGPNWDMDWDTRKFSNGKQTLWAVATGSEMAVWSPQVTVTVHN
ncbi:Ig-like domain-containing protein [Streptomyces cinnabarinus]|uniref:Ig-like domain-containing protein n=1 Tax=Streptomyces cinnabarinus TaxID=67287 RepID=A0ABY7KRZ0_9ACTN|nr:Ig-like domain-containing protein [Streptomyces cinnabarinus]WAZ27344.1 Ig-like domain-containing protein [Streptomyces cinnabarinus]